MDVVDWMQGMALFACPIVAYILLFKNGEENRRKHGRYSQTYWNFFLKKWWASTQLPSVKRCIPSSILPSREQERLEYPQRLEEEENVDGMSLLGIDQKGNKIQIKVSHQRYRTVEVWVLVQLDNGNTYQLPNHPDTTIHDITTNSWNVGGLNIQMVEPLRKWRISFNGILRRGSRRVWTADENEEDYEHIRFSFIWTACSAPVDIQADWSRSLHSSALAREPWRDGAWKTLGKEFGNGYDQWGTLYGTWTGADSVAKVLHVRGIRQRFWGDDQAVWQHRRVTITGVAANGLFFTLMAASSRHGLTHATFGHVRLPNGVQLPIDWTDFSLPATGENRDAIPATFVVRFTASKTHYTAVVDTQPQCDATLYGGRPWNQEVRLKQFQCAINSHQGAGVVEFWYRYTGPCPVEIPPAIHALRQSEVKSSPLVVSLQDKECRSSLVVGGKGMSLALMASYNDNELNVPPGFCLTVSALELQLEQSAKVREALAKLEGISCGQLPGDLKRQCELTVALVESETVCQEVAAATLAQLRTLDPSAKLAVRSSAVGEDSEDLSAAGQNATLLGRRPDDVLSAITMCWASLYTFQSVTYRRQHGQEVLCGMGVVVQVMVPADSAGVLFTRHPLTGNPSQVLITANYGLGESVVSALIEPDTIILSRDRKDRLSLKETQCGTKTHKVAMLDDGDVTTSSLEEKDASKLCISTEEALALGRLGVQLETMFGGPRDVEWAIVNGRIHLLQARPITSLYAWSDFDLVHEHDSPVITDDEAATIANTGEVFPGASSPLTLSWVVRALDQSVVEGTASESSGEGHFYYSRNVVQSHYHVMLNVMNTLLSSVESTLTVGNKIADLAVFGHLVTTPELHRLGIERNGVMGLVKKIKTTLFMIMDAYGNKNNVKAAKALCDQFTLVPENYATAGELFDAITASFPHMYNASKYHGKSSRVSTFSQFVAISVLLEGQEEFTTEHFSDISYMLSSYSNIVSAEIPTALKGLSDAIVNTGHGAEFASKPPTEALQWLTENSAYIATSLTEFLSRHEHRGIREFDLMTETWGMKPEIVIETLQTMVRVGSLENKPKQASQDVKPSELSSPKKSGTKRALRWLMAWCQSSVSRREDTKACLIAVVHKFRRAFRHLGALLVREGRIPDADLVFHFTYHELGQILRSRDSTILAKATRRKRLWSQWDHLSFPEIVRGLPAPIVAASSASLSSTLRLEATPVCPGTVMGRACVVLRLDEINQLQSGDILITHSTDIGWSPYFPLLGGVVTELGGLISHGAVVAREYGLPCIVGAQGATSIFQTGDTVLLVGASGTLEKIEPSLVEDSSK